MVQPHLARAVAADLLTISAIAVIALLASVADRYIYLDVAPVYGLLSFLGVLAVARYLEKGFSPCSHLYDPRVVADCKPLYATRDSTRS